MDSLPTHLTLMNPTLAALGELGGSASTDELAARAISLLKLPASVTSKPHGDGGMTEVEYRLAWARTYLKKVGLLENSSRGVWALTPKGRATPSVDPKEVAREVKRLSTEYTGGKALIGTTSEPVPPEGVEDWRVQLLGVLLKMAPAGFERLCQRLLRESGFVEVEVTGRSGDGGIDGNGILRLAGIISFRVAFQAKRYQGNVGAGVVRDFRGAMVGRADKGVIITTGGFTADARAEAVRDGAPPIDLISGEDLVEKLHQLRLGVQVTQRTIEDVTVNEGWLLSV